MCQSHVERVIGRLVTDEGLRRRFTRDPWSTLGALVDQGLQLNRCELHALGGLDPRRLEEFAERLDARLQKIELPGGNLP